MDKYKTFSAFNKWVSPINLEKLSKSSKQTISDFNSYRKKLDFKALLALFLYGIHEERESLRDLSTSLLNQSLQKETDLTSISYSQLSRDLNTLNPLVLEEIFQQLLKNVQEKTVPTKRNSLYLIDSSTFSLSLKRHQWAEFRSTKSGVKLHLKLCFMDNEKMYPSEFTLTNAKEQDIRQLETLVNQPEATYVFDRGYLDLKRMDRMQQEGYFFVTRIKKHIKVHVLDTFELPTGTNRKIVSDQHVILGSTAYSTSRFRLVTMEDEKGKKLQFITNRFDFSAEEVAQAYKSRWPIELFFKHIKQHMTIKTFFTQSERGVHNQLILTMIAALLTLQIEKMISVLIVLITKLGYSLVVQIQAHLLNPSIYQPYREN